MMNSNSTHKIVVGIGLAVVFGVGVSVFAVRAKEASDLARNAPAPALAAPADQNATDTAAPAQSPAVPSSTDQTAPASGATPSVPAAAPPPDAHSGQTSDDYSPAAKWDREDRNAAKTRNSADYARSRVGSVAHSKSSPLQASAASASDTASSSAAGATAEAQPSPAAQETAMTADGPASSSAPVADGQITASVKSEVATAAPISDLNVTTTDGVVALAGSVPSEDAVDQAKQAALRVAGVKRVDASGLTVSDR
jgi:hyperosmotically inducible protein